MAFTVREFIHQSYRLINASNPTIPDHGDDFSFMLRIMNQLLQSYASTGLLLTIAKTETCAVNNGDFEVIVGPPDFTPTPQIVSGRLANLDNAWLVLNGVTYPLIDKSRDEYLAAWKYEPLKGLPRFVIVFPDTNIVRIRLYPAPSQFYDFFIRGKFQFPELTKDDTMGLVPQYYIRYFLLAVSKDTAFYKGRADAWTSKLEDALQQATDIMVASSEVNLSISGDEQSLLNGAWRVRAGV